jgi:hypothetical protein
MEGSYHALIARSVAKAGKPTNDRSGVIRDQGGRRHQTEKHVPEAGLRLFESRFVADELINLLGARA